MHKLGLYRFKLYAVTGDARYLNAALKLLDFVKASQNTSSFHPGVRGGVKGSQPISGKYSRFCYVNWGAKFFADALMMEDYIMSGLEKSENQR